MSELTAARPHHILAAGLSPAWQQILVFDEFRTGEVNRACEVHWCGSGKVLNVGVALSHLARFHPSPNPSPPGERRCCSRTLSVIGPRARAAIGPEFAELDVACRWIETAGETRICTTIVDRGSSRTTELVENAAPLDADIIAQFRDTFVEEAARADVVVLTGSLPAGVPLTLYRDLLDATAASIILDARGPELLAALDRRPLVVKPNREELARTLGRDLTSDGDLHAAMRELNDRGAQWVIITNGANAVWAKCAGAVYRFDPPHFAHVVNPIGSGDCLAAGIAWGTVNGMEMLDAIRLGIAAAVDNVGQLLPGRLDGPRMAKLIDAVTVSKFS